MATNSAGRCRQPPRSSRGTLRRAQGKLRAMALEANSRARAKKGRPGRCRRATNVLLCPTLLPPALAGNERGAAPGRYFREIRVAALGELAFEQVRGNVDRRLVPSRPRED